MRLTNLLRLEELQCSGNGPVVDRCQVYVYVCGVLRRPRQGITSPQSAEV